jgi:DUF4097 and DUF4098 domain-containing protein YvlB/vacuolar-type H+-ATPase subunit H
MREEQAVSKEEKMMILQMVAEGKVTPEQGAELLRAVGEGKPGTPAVPPVPPVPLRPPSELKESIRKSIDSSIHGNMQRTIERAARQAEGAAERAASHAEEWADRIAKRAEEFAEQASKEGENLGKILGEGGENIGKIIAKLFTGGSFPGGPQFEFHEEVKGEIPAEGEVQVSLSTSNGRVTVDTWDEKGFRLDVRKTANAPTEEEAKEIVKDGFEFGQDGLNISARSKESPNIMRNGYSIGFTLTLPRDRKASLRLSSSNGRITVGGVSGTKLHATTANGRVEAEDCEFQDSQIESANGRIGFRGHPGDLKASTANGRIGARLRGTGSWKLDSANGRIDVEVQKEPGAAYEVDLSTVMGRLDVSEFEDAEVLINDTRHKFGARRYKARTRGFSDAASKASISASTTVGRVTVTF